MQIYFNFNQMFKRLRLHVSQHRMLLLATVFSLILHSLLVGQFSITVPELHQNPQKLEMRLVELKPVKHTAPKPAKQAKSKPTPPAQALKKITASPEPESKAEDGDDIPTLVETPYTKQSALSSTSLAMWQPPSVKVENTISETTVMPQTAIIDEPMASTEIQAYSHITTEFEVRRGGDASAAGETIIDFNIDKNGGYSIISTTKAKGLASLFFGTLIQESTGNVTENGLVPIYFKYQYGNADKKLQYANFSWPDHIIEMHSIKGNKVAPLLAGTQDLLSFMYQFMFTPPLKSMQITMTNGKNLRTYTYSFEGEKLITTKLGELEAIHLLKSGEDDEKTELWLAVDYQFIPIKIRKTEKNGSIIEQTATKLSTNSPSDSSTH